MFAHQATKEWCAPAGVQITLAALGLADNSEAFQRTIESRIDEWESRQDSRDGGWGPAAMAQALAAYGAPGTRSVPTGSATTSCETRPWR